MSVPSATTLHVAIQQTNQAARPRDASTDKMRQQHVREATSVKDSVSLSADVKSAYRAQQTDAQVAPRTSSSAQSSKQAQISPSDIRDLSSQMRRLSTEATQSRASEQNSPAPDTNPSDLTAAVPLSDTLTADDRPQASFTPLADAPQTTSGDAPTGDDSQRSASTPTPEASAEGETQGTGMAVDSSATLQNLDHALGKIVRGRSAHGANFESLAEATRLSVRQRESLAVAHSEGGGHELASAAAQTGRGARLQKSASLAPATPTASADKETKVTYTKAARKA